MGTPRLWRASRRAPGTIIAATLKKSGRLRAHHGSGHACRAHDRRDYRAHLHGLEHAQYQRLLPAQPVLRGSRDGTEQRALLAVQQLGPVARDLADHGRPGLGGIQWHSVHLHADAELPGLDGELDRKCAQQDSGGQTGHEDEFAADQGPGDVQRRQHQHLEPLLLRRRSRNPIPVHALERDHRGSLSTSGATSASTQTGTATRSSAGPRPPCPGRRSSRSEATSTSPRPGISATAATS